MIDAYRGGSLLGLAGLLRGAPLFLALLALLAASAPLRADEEEDPPEQLDLICVEQPMRVVAFGEPGELSYDEQAPRTVDPIEVRISKSRPGEDFNYDFAIIESSADDLETEEAIWLADKQIEAQQGRFKLNLSNLVMTLTETDADGGARFRRFECEPRAADETASQDE
ncbi:MAG: hypothetical protein ACOC26_05310 [Halochromatium sp.]